MRSRTAVPLLLAVFSCLGCSSETESPGSTGSAANGGASASSTSANGGSGAGGEGGGPSTSSAGGSSSGGGGSGGMGGAAGGAGGAGGAVDCDTLACGDATTGCIACSMTGVCAAQAQACESDPDCTAFIACDDACNGDPDCEDQCFADHRDGATLFAALYVCANCVACPTSCNNPAC